MAQEPRLWAPTERCLHILQAASIPPLAGTGNTVAREGHVQMENYRQAQLTTIVKEPDRIGIVITHAKLKLSKNTNSMNVNGGFQLLVGVGIAGINRCPRNEPVGITFRDIDHIMEGDSNSGWTQAPIVPRIHLAFRYLPAQQPGAFDAGRIHVLYHARAVIADPARMTVNINDAMFRLPFPLILRFLLTQAGFAGG